MGDQAVDHIGKVNPELKANNGSETTAEYNRFGEAHGFDD